MAIQKPNLTRVWASAAFPANVVDPDAVIPNKFEDGWTTEVPPFQFFNFIQQSITQGLGHWNEQGVGVWDSATGYSVGSLAKGSDRQIYFCIAASTNNNPVTDGGTHWVKQTGAINVAHFGVHPQNPDNTAAWAALLATNPKHVHFSQPGNYVFLSSTTHASSIKITAADGVVIDCSSPAFVGEEWTRFKGGVSTLPLLVVDPTEGGSSLNFTSAPSVLANDVIILYNPAASSFSGFDNSYFAGEFCKVISVSGTVVSLSAPLYSNYLTASVQSFKLSPITVEIEGLTLKGGVVNNLIELRMTRNSVLKNINFIQNGDSCLRVNRSYNTTIKNITSFNQGLSAEDGIVIRNCQDMIIDGCNIHSKQHAISVSAADGGFDVSPCPVNRNITISNAVLSKDNADIGHNINIQGNSEYCRAINCTIYGGATWQGKNNGYENCLITARTDGVCIIGIHILGGELYARGCSFKTYVSPEIVNRGIIDIGGNTIDAVNANTVLNCNFEVTGCNFRGENQSALESICKMYNRGSVKTLNYKIEKLILDVNDFDKILQTELVSGTALSNYVIIDDIVAFNLTGKLLVSHVGNAYLNFPHRLQSESGNREFAVTLLAEAVDSPLITYKWIYPRIPNVTTSSFNRPNGWPNRELCSMIINTESNGILQMSTTNALAFGINSTIFGTYRVAIEEV